MRFLSSLLIFCLTSLLAAGPLRSESALINQEQLNDQEQFDHHKQPDQDVQLVHPDQDLNDVKEVPEADQERQEQNPILNTIRIPFEWNAFPDTQWAPNSIDPTARHDRSLFDFKIKPVIPFKLNDDWSLLTYTVFRFVSVPWAEPQPSLTAEGIPYLDWKDSRKSGLSTINPTAIIVPDISPDWTVGLGPSVVAPVSSFPRSTEQWLAGPALFALYRNDSMLVGARLHNMWSFAGNQNMDDINLMILRPIIQLSINDDWFLISSPIITADWTHQSGKGWTLPLGGGIGRRISMGQQQLLISLQGYYNVLKPEVDGDDLLGDWNVRTEVVFLLPR